MQQFDDMNPDVYIFIFNFVPIKTPWQGPLGSQNIQEHI